MLFGNYFVIFYNILLSTCLSTVFSSADESPTFVPSTPLKSKRIFFSSAASSSDADSTTVSHPLAQNLKVTPDSSDTEKDDRPAKRQRVSSGQNGQKSSSSKKKGQRSLENEESPSLLTNAEDSVSRSNKTKNGRVADLSKPRRSRRSSIRIQNQAVESEESNTDVNKDKVNGVEVLSSRLSELKSDSVKAKKGRRSSMIIPKQTSVNQESKKEESKTDVNKDTVSGVEVLPTRLSELKSDSVKAKKGHRSSMIFPKQTSVNQDEDARTGVGNSSVTSLESRMDEDRSTNGTCVATSRLSELKSDSVKTKKGRRSSMIFPKQTSVNQDEDAQTGAGNSSVTSLESRMDDNKGTNGTGVTTSRLSELKSDSGKAKKGRRSSMQIPNRKSEDQVKNKQTEAGDSLVSSIDVVRTSNSDVNQNNSSITSTEKAKSVNSDLKLNSSRHSNLATEIPASSVTQKRGRRKLMSLSSQCQPSEELIVPSQSTTKSNRNVLGNDPFMFPNLGEEEEKQEESKKKKCGRQKKSVASSSRKRKNLVSSSESENEPPNGKIIICYPVLILKKFLCCLRSGIFLKLEVLFVCLFVYFFFILGPYSEENLSIPLFFHIAQSQNTTSKLPSFLLAGHRAIFTPWLTGFSSW